MNTFRFGAALLPAALLSGVAAQPAEHRLGEHPAVIVKRLSAAPAYDYASKFYPHPAWLHLLPEAPRPMMDHPAVIVFRRQTQESPAHAATLASSQHGSAPH